ncbi:1-phosphatidylinositol 3-phosphate 5-kinase isoform X1 [Lagopus muta]|uniref:1-phosphatidylinositol 3-phosphate 5-kinase isoform X1 n=2 Tax=Lagopus muta TaxID=64668 RepID=UPI0020A1CCB5|nr:1-phosphatidylinositol 3-phosphate 5-kinase isoform X1 [Lagopus muta]XP_048808794.1 1-phosphatidylinositol 3-phosphate 5-kinase isoform X1 [Lagopus muta]XP_048808795.1 1-phosphatidylinositol 3-phosphate 5-kinase isoform X1 [Lagopus muta]
MAADDKRSPTLDSTSDLPRSPSSPSHLTHFKPLTPDQDEPPFKSAYSSFVNLFRFSKDDGRLSSPAERAEAAQADSQALSSSWSSPQHPPRAQSLRSPVTYKKQLTGELQRRSSSTLDNRRKVEPPLGGHDPRTAVQLRSLSTVLKRLKEIMEGKSQDSDLKQYWMPDSQCKECYDCSEKFTTFRRRHHCRLCGQIFCSRCCNQEIPGKFMGYTGDLRACTYCRKIALSYAHSTDSNSIGEDLNALSDSACSVSVLDPGEPRTPVGSRKASRNIFLEEDLTWQSLIHPDSSTTTLSARLGSVQEDAGKSPARNRSASITNLSLDRSGSPMVPSYETSVSPQASRTHMKAETSEDERKILLDSVQLKDLWKKICHHNSGMEFQDHRYWLRTHPNCIVGKELVNWLIRNGHITTRVQAIAIGQALVDGRWLDCVSHHDQLFRDEYALYRPLQSTEFSETPSPDSDSVNSVEGHSEPSWFKDIKFDDSDTEQIADEGEDNLANSASPSKRTSVSSFQSTMDSDSAASISLNVEMDNVNFHIKKHSKYPHVPPHPADQKEYLNPDNGGQQMFSISDAFIKESLFNRRVEEKSKEVFFTPLGWHHSNLDLLREENGEKQAMERLLSANHNHMMALLQQLLYNESLSLSWRDIIVPVVCQVVQTVRPDVKNRDDDMDIRQFVHIKKIPGGKKFDSMVVNGFVCTKNVAHKKMNSCIKNPKILLLKCSIEYLYREETKFTCIDPIVLQEREFLKNYVQRIVDVRPNLVLVEKTVSRIAQDMLLEHGITLVINVKPQVLDRVSRMTQGDLVMSMDQLLTKPRLGTCHKFYMQVFQLPYDQTKTLMFFEGCPQHLGCTIKLCGAAEYELARVKEILIFMICVAYHSQLEISFLMDEFAMPPTLTKNTSFHSLIEEPGDENEQQDLFNGEDFSTTIRDIEPSAEKLPVISESVSSDEVTLLEQRGLFERGDQENSQLETVPSKQQEHHKMESSFPVFHSVPPVVPETSLLPLHGMDQHLVTLDSQPLEPVQQADDLQESKNQMRVFRDPLQDDTGLYVTEEVTSSEDRLKTYSAAFKQELKDVILSISPVMVFREPFLLTEKGMRCPAREYFPEQVYWSPLLNKEYKELESRRKRQLLRDLSGLQGMNGSVQAKAIQILPSHELVSTRIAEHLGDSQSLARMLADYRARGGRILQRSTDPFAQIKDVSSVPAGRTGCKIEEDEKGLAQNESSWSHKVDCLSPVNHQRLCVLFSSSSAQSSNAPSACVSPWIVTMEFYGKNDLTLGIFLERYCFRPSYQCPSMFCETPMVHHIRRFVHGQGCVQIVLKELDSPVPGYQHTILTYSWCRLCKQVTPVVPLSSDSWSMSFAKYLELRFYGHQYTRRANAEPCGHSIHHDYHQYFSYNQMVASFSYSPIRLLEVCVPLPKIYIKRQAPLKVTILQDLKDFSQKVSQVYLAVDDRLASLKTDTFSKTREEKMEDLFAQKEMEEGEFRNWTEKIQARLLSSSLDTPQQLQSIFESLIAKKQGLCEMLQAWNSRLQDLFQQEKGRKRPSVPPSPGRLRQGEESKISSMDASPRNVSPALQNGEKEDRFLTTLSSQSSTGSTHLQLPTPPEVVSEQLTGANTLSEQDTTSSSEDVFDGHSLGSTDSQVKEKSTMKAILANLLPGNNYNPIPFPLPLPRVGLKWALSGCRSGSVAAACALKSLSRENEQAGKFFQLLCLDPDKHYLMYEHERVPIAVCEKEPSSIIAFALSCKEYRNALDELSKASPKNGTEEGLQANSTSDGKPKSGSPVRLPEANMGPSNRAAEVEQPKKPSSVLSFFRGTGGKSPDLSSQKKETLRGADSAYYQVGQMGKEGVENQGAEPQDEVDGGDGQKKQLVNPHVELQFSDANAKFYCRIYYAGEFHKMREVILGSSEEDFIRSLSHSMPWQARGGKSGAAFYVTEDDRFILKQMPRLEVQSFLDFAPHYFTYITNAVQQKKPTALAKILGVYRIGYKNSQNNTEKKLDLLVMENLFYGRKMAQVFDLKGSLRNRNVKTDTGKESCDVVLLDENLLKMVRDNPLYIRSHCKAVLRASIHSDSQFLSSHLIIDYSLLVGRDDTNNELVVGIIDYIRTFTWDKKLEMVVKSTGILGGQGKMPTVVSPELYRTRFCEAMDKYFLMVPDHWTGLGLNC